MRTANLTVYDRDRNPIGELQFTNQQVRDAIERYDREYPSNDYPRTYETSYVKTWLENDAFRFAIRRRFRSYTARSIKRAGVSRSLKSLPMNFCASSYVIIDTYPSFLKAIITLFSLTSNPFCLKIRPLIS